MTGSFVAIQIADERGKTGVHPDGPAREISLSRAALRRGRAGHRGEANLAIVRGIAELGPWHRRTHQSTNDAVRLERCPETTSHNSTHRTCAAACGCGSKVRMRRPTPRGTIHCPSPRPPSIPKLCHHPNKAADCSWLVRSRGKHGEHCPHRGG